MTPDKIREIIELYRAYFEKHQIEAIDYPHDKIVYSQNATLGHCHGMLDKMSEFILAGRIEKTFRWLGFVQGCLWASGIHTLEDLQNHNSSPD